jgi:hypothetical protein
VVGVIESTDRATTAGHQHSNGMHSDTTSGARAGTAPAVVAVEAMRATHRAHESSGRDKREPRNVRTRAQTNLEPRLQTRHVKTVSTQQQSHVVPVFVVAQANGALHASNTVST